MAGEAAGGTKVDPSTGFTCTCCRVAFAGWEVQRDHYKTEWHRYNAKRNVTGFQPISAEQFAMKLSAYQEELEAENNNSSQMYVCECCNKQFHSKNAYSNHVTSKKHREIAAQTDHKNTPAVVPKRERMVTERSPILNDQSEAALDSKCEESIDNNDDAEGWVTDHGTDDDDQGDYDIEFNESEAIPENHCLFCNQKSNNSEDNIFHMSKAHGFFIPDVEYCVDVPGLINYSAMKVGSGNMCLFCSERRKFFSLDACQKHMRDKAHCRIANGLKDMIEYEDFYDYSPLYPEAAEGDDADVMSGTVVDLSSVGEGDTGHFFVLPSGAVIGHRSLMRYFRQHFHPNNALVKLGGTSKDMAKRISGQYKALGWSGPTNEMIVRRVKDITYMKRMRMSHSLKVGMKGNKLFKSNGRCGQ